MNEHIVKTRLKTMHELLKTVNAYEKLARANQYVAGTLAGTKNKAKAQPWNKQLCDEVAELDKVFNDIKKLFLT